METHHTGSCANVHPLSVGGGPKSSMHTFSKLAVYPGPRYLPLEMEITLSKEGVAVLGSIVRMLVWDKVWQIRIFLLPHPTRDLANAANFL